MAKFFSVAVELNDGSSSILPVSGDSRGVVFQQAKERPDVRRVGRISEIDRDAWEAMRRGEAPPAPRPVAQDASPAQHAPSGARGGASGHGGRSHPHTNAKARHEPSPAENPGSAEGDSPSARLALAQPLRGPRIVIDAPRRGGFDQPFRRPKPPAYHAKPAAPKAAPLVLRPVPTAQPVPTPPAAAPAPAPAAQPAAARLNDAATHHAATDDAAPDAATLRPEYRIVKSRRQTGEPYLLQRGHWREQKGKRVFEADWEKGFAEREKAEHHQAWVERNARELAEVNEEVSAG